LPKATRGWWNVGTGTGEQKLIERLAGTLEGTVEIGGSIQIVNVLSGSFVKKEQITGRIIDKDTLGGTLDV
jgi:hypothetical protein